ncbi:MAG: glycoside hydrolase family 16 protein [Treponema sp.]|jgi:beta-glucanase (GH16 family)|nr:glycoside hydrolase family 16 protein [Treponema sp.]
MAFYKYILAFSLLMAVSVLNSCATKSEKRLTIHTPEIYKIKVPVAGNYPQGLYKYRFKAGYNSMETEIETFTQTLEWLPAVKKTFETDTKYTAILTLNPLAGYIFGEMGINDIQGLPTTGVEEINIEIINKNLVIKIIFERTHAEKAAPQIIFSDDFNGTSLDTSKWEPSPEWDTGGKTGRSTWKSDMVSVSGGYLHLRFMRDPELGSSKTNDSIRANNWIRSGAIVTNKQKWPHGTLFENTYGFYEARVKVPAVKGTWGAFWLPSPTQNIFWEARGTESHVVESIKAEGKDGTEIDIFESISNEKGRYNAALHWNGYGKFHKSVGTDDNLPLPASIYDGEFHTFALDWSSSEYVFYVDNVEFWRVDGGPEFNNSGINQNPNTIALSVEGAVWAGELPENFTEDEMLVDYVKVWNQPQINN